MPNSNPADSQDELVLYLFSSNTSPQYEQDIVNVLSAPGGSVYVFRYDAKYVASEIRGAAWDGLAGREVLVCFSIQQKAQYADAAFIPVRLGRVSATRRIGSQHIVEFELGELISLKPSAVAQPSPGKEVRDFTTLLRANASDVPYVASAASGTSILKNELLLREPQPMVFEQSATLLAQTQSFEQSRFVRFDSVTGDGSDSKSLTDHRLALDAGKTYELRLVHHQPAGVSAPEKFLVSADNQSLTVIGRSDFDVASRYNEIRIKFHTALLETSAKVETVLVIEPAPGVRGPRIEIPVLISPPTSRVVLSVATPVVVLALIGIPSAANADSTLKIGLAVLGTTIAGFASYFGLKPISMSNVYGSGATAKASPAPAPPNHSHG